MFQRPDLSAVFTLLFHHSNIGAGWDAIELVHGKNGIEMLPQLRCACCVYEKLAVNPRFDFLKKNVRSALA